MTIPKITDIRAELIFLPEGQAMLTELLFDLYNRVVKLESIIAEHFPGPCEHPWCCFDDQYNTRECIKCGQRREGEIT